MLLEEQQRAVDLVITDVKSSDVPGAMDGVEFVRRIAERRLVGNLHHRLGAWTGRSSASIEAMAKGFGLDVAGHVPRPISPESCGPWSCAWWRAGRRHPCCGSRSVHVTVEDLRHAIAEKQFVPHFQPRVRAVDGVVTACEALIRWNHPDRGLVPPGAFIPLADRTGLIDGITEVVLEKSINWARVWRDAGIDIAVSVNLTENALNQPGLPERIAELAKQHDVEHRRILLEVTESAAITDVAMSLEALARLRIMGFGLSIDDFGTGMGTPEQLARGALHRSEDRSGAGHRRVRPAAILRRAGIFAEDRQETGLEDRRRRGRSESGLGSAEGTRLRRDAGLLHRASHAWRRDRRLGARLAPASAVGRVRVAALSHSSGGGPAVACAPASAGRSRVPPRYEGRAPAAAYFSRCEQ